MLRVELALIIRILLLVVYFGSIDSGVLRKDGASSTSLWESKSTNLTLTCCEFTPHIRDIYRTDNLISFECSEPPKELQDCFHHFKVARLYPTSLERIYDSSINCSANLYDFENLKSETYYRFRVAACSDYDKKCCTWSHIRSAITREEGIEQVPICIIAEGATLHSISIRWSSVYYLNDSCRVKATCEDETVGPFEVNRATLTYVFQGLKAECSYIVVLQIASHGYWRDLYRTQVRTMDRDPRFIPTVFVTELTATSISIEWLMPPPEVRNRIRQYKILATSDGDVGRPTHLPATRRFYRFQDLRIFETYTIKVAACSEFRTQCGDWNKEVEVFTESRESAKTTILSVIATTDRSIKIGWYEERLDVMSIGMSYKVMVTCWDQILKTILLPGNVTSYDFDNLTSNTSYFFRVAVCWISTSDYLEDCDMWSPEKEALTIDRDPIFIPMVWIAATTNTSIEIGWSMLPKELQHRLHQYKVVARDHNRTRGPVYLDRTLNSYIFENLRQETHYSVKVAACSDYITQCGNWSSEMKIRTMDRDPKFVPTIRRDGNTHDSITVIWSTPPPKLRDHIHHYKVVAVHPKDERGPFYVNRTINSYVFRNLASETGYRLRVAACSDWRTICGKWSCELEVFTIDEDNRTQNNILVGLPVAVVLLVVLFIWIIIRRYRRKVAKKKQMDETLKLFNMEGPDCLDPELNMAERAELLPYNRKWEYPRELLQLGKILGSGAFGIVRKGLAKSILRKQNITTVAVKMVLATNRLTYMEALTRELKILAYLGKHVNVVNLLGACTGRVSYGELLVIVEYCRYGNIRDYLICSSADFLDQIDEITENIPDSIPATEDVDVNESHENTSINDGCRVAEDGCDSGKAEDPSPKVDDYVPSAESAPRDFRSRYDGDYADPSLAPIGTRDLLCWTWQILHGDLTARNVLRADNNVVKICDFGMATALYKEENFKKKGHGPLPVKWMAIESLRDRIFSVKYALQNMYQIMRSCWDESPSERPSFQKLEDSIAPLLEESVKMLYVDMSGEYLDLEDDIFASGGEDEPVVDQFRFEHEAGDMI